MCLPSESDVSASSASCKQRGCYRLNFGQSSRDVCSPVAMHSKLLELMGSITITSVRPPPSAFMKQCDKPCGVDRGRQQMVSCQQAGQQKQPPSHCCLRCTDLKHCSVPDQHTEGHLPHSNTHPAPYPLLLLQLRYVSETAAMCVLCAGTARQPYQGVFDLH